MLSKEIILKTIRSQKPKLNGLGVRNIGLFGSYLYDLQTDKSDIDILLDFEADKETFDNYMKVCDLIEELFRNESVEIVTKNGLSPYIGPKILKEVLYV